MLINDELLDPFDEVKPPRIITLTRIISHAPTSVLGGALGNWLKDRRNSRQIPHRLKACGYVPVRNPAYEGDGRWVIARKRQVVYGKSELRRSEISLIERAIKEGKSVVALRDVMT